MIRSNRQIWEAYQALFAMCAIEGLKNSDLVGRLALNKNHLQPHYAKLDGTRLDLVRMFKVQGLQRVTPDGTPIRLAEDERDALDKFDEAWHATLEKEPDEAAKNWTPAAVIQLAMFKGQPKMPNGNELAATALLGIIVIPTEPAAPLPPSKTEDTGVV